MFHLLKRALMKWLELVPRYGQGCLRIFDAESPLCLLRVQFGYSLHLQCKVVSDMALVLRAQLLSGTSSAGRSDYFRWRSTMASSS